ncbi:MAG: transposase [Candidatus Dormibacteria bacterium]
MSCRQSSSRRRAKAKGQSLPKDEDRYNFTDPESRIVVYGDKAFIQGYHYQAAVDDTPRYRLAAEVSNQAADNPHLVPMVRAVMRNIGGKPCRFSADAGNGAAANLAALAELGIDAYIAPRRERDPVAAAAPWGLIPQAMAIRPRMARKLRSQAGRAVRKRRKPVAEPPFGVIKQAMGFRRVHMRGLT